MSDVRLYFSRDIENEEEAKALVAQYVKNIASSGCTPIYNIEHLSVVCGFEEALLYSISNRSELFYRSFSIPKKDGTKRKISEPLATLKEIQHSLLENIFSRPKPSRAARAYKLGTSIKSNASLHVRQKALLNVDISDFFGSIHFSKVEKIVYELGYTKELSMIIANLCCKNGFLPQGSPTSPAISNLYMYDFDELMLTECRRVKARYSRYSDDITISGEFDVVSMLRFIRSKLKKKDLTLNDKKTSLSRNGSRKMVTGIVVNDKLNAPIELRRNFWRDAYFIEKY